MTTRVTVVAKEAIYSTHNTARITVLGKLVVYSLEEPSNSGGSSSPPVFPGVQRATLYVCEAQGPRIIAFGIGNSQVGDEYQFELETWDLIPSGEVGDNLFRSVNVAVKAQGAFVLGVTPIVDGVELAEQVFSRAGSGDEVCQALVQSPRGARCSVRVRTLQRAGDLEIENISVTFTPIRVFP